MSDLLIDAADGAEAGASDSSATAPRNLAAGTGSLDRPTTRPHRIQRLLTWRNSFRGGVFAFAGLGRRRMANMIRCRS